MAVTLLLILALLAAVAAWRRERRRRKAAQSSLGISETARDAVQRAARIASLDLREAALRVHGQMQASTTPALAGVATRLRLLADDLGEAGMAQAAPSLRDEPIDLWECAREATVALGAAISPGWRHFRLPDPPDAEWIWADRRAVRQILLRVLADAVFNTGPADSITLAIERGKTRVTLVIADEGAGLAHASPGAPGETRDTRGVGTALGLARGLMEAHGGQLSILAHPATGTKVSLLFPSERRRPQPGPAHGNAPGPAATVPA